MRIHSTVASPALPVSSQALAKSSGDSFLSILSSASAGQNPGAIGPDEDPHADGDARGAEADSKEQNETPLMTTALDGGIRNNGSGQHIVQKNDSVVESASTEGQNTATSNGPRVAVPGARPTGTSEQTKDASTAHGFVSPAEAPTQASIEAQATVGSLQGGLANSSAAAAFNSTLLAADDPGSGGENVQPLFLSVPDSSAENGAGLQTSGSIRTNPSGAEAAAGVLGSLLPPVTAPLGANSTLNFAQDPSGDDNPGQANPLGSALFQQGDGSWSGFVSTEKSADRADGPSVAVMQGLGSAQRGLKPLSDLPVPEKMMPAKQSTSAANPILSNASSGTAGKSTDPVASVAATEAGIAGIVPVALPALPARAATGSGNQSVVNSPTKASANPADIKNTTAVSATDATSGNAIDNGNGAVEGSSHTTQSTGQPAQNTPALTLGTVTNGADSAAARVQTQVPVAQADATTAAGTHRMPEGSGVPSELAGQQAASGPIHEEGSEPVATSSINTARLMQTMSESEMRVGMHSSEFGDISIRTSVSQQQMVAQITLDHGDLSQAIAAHASTLQAKLGEDYGIHASIEVHNLGSGFGNDPGQSSQREQRDFRHSARAEIGLPGAEASSSIQFAAVASISSGNRLDIRA
jgi:hypothetical protein